MSLRNIFSPQLETKKICQHFGIYVKTITGGKTNKMLLDPPVEKVDIIIASFGVISKLTTNKIYKLDMVKSIVLDEADALFHETFEEKLQVFLKKIPVYIFISFKLFIKFIFNVYRYNKYIKSK